MKKFLIALMCFFTPLYVFAEESEEFFYRTVPKQKVNLMQGMYIPQGDYSSPEKKQKKVTSEIVEQANSRPGIDAIKEPDFGPYMRDLQRRIKRNWNPPKGNESKRVVLLFRVGKDGKLLSYSIHKSSGSTKVDQAALDALKLTSPFRPLPPEFTGDFVDIQFTFDYNVFGNTNK